jgi:hypothetical protein
MDAHDEIRINRLDLRFAHAFDFYGSDATFAVQVENLLDGHSDYYNDNRRHPNFFARLSFETL